MMRFVLDCSVTMAWCFSDEADDYADALLDSLAKAKAVVPSLWPLEVANVLLVAERRHRLTAAQSMHFLDLLAALPILVDKDTGDHAWSTSLSLAREHNLSSYDSTYLDLAMRSGLPLATTDERLVKTARRVGARILTKKDLAR